MERERIEQIVWKNTHVDFRSSRKVDPSDLSSERIMVKGSDGGVRGIALGDFSLPSIARRAARYTDDAPTPREIEPLQGPTFKFSLFRDDGEHLCRTTATSAERAAQQAPGDLDAVVVHRVHDGRNIVVEHSRR